MAQRNYYQVLGVDKSASQDQIRSAYRKLARQYHPDVNKDPEAAAKFAEVTEAYDVLADAEKRKSYDRFGRTGVGAGAGEAGRGGAAWGPGGARTYTWTSTGGEGFGETDVEFGDVFEQMFGGAGFRGRSPFGRGTGGFGAQRTGGVPPHERTGFRARGRDVHHTIATTFLTAAMGGTETLRFEGTAGRGPETIEVKIPPGIDSGAKLRIKGKGHPGETGGEAGDLILSVQVGSHPYFRREGLDVLIDVPITIAEAMHGTSVTVPLLEGRADLTVPPGTSSGRKLRIRGKGFKDAKGRQGDFYAVVQIDIPAGGAASLSDESREAIERMAKELPSPRSGPPWV